MSAYAAKDKAAHKAPLPLELVRNIAWQTCAGIAYCHAKGVLHRDLKPANLLVSGPGVEEVGPERLLQVCVADFGLATTLRHAEQLPCEYAVCTLPYRSPEIVLGGLYGAPIVVWALGCIITEIATDREVFRDRFASEWGTLMCIFRYVGAPDRASWPTLPTLP